LPVVVLVNAQIDRLSVADQVYEHVRSAILRGHIPQGTRVVEAQIAKNLKISRAPVREAVNRLLQDGLLESKTHYGPSVIQMTAEKIRYLYDLRSAIEGLAIREVVRRRRDIDLTPLRKSITDMKRLARKKDLAGVVNAELEFHRILCGFAQNSYVVKVSEMIDAQVRMALTIDNAAYDNLSEIADEHEPIIAAIEGGDEDAAAALMTLHILSSLAGMASSAKPADGRSRD
jgi:DNA-binding GntR family transcriptional regulator